MITVANRIYVKQEYTDAFEQRFRERAGLARALQTLEGAWTELDAQLRNGDPLDADQWRRASLLTVGRLIARAALRREESRGGHYRSDFPRRDDINWMRRITETR